MSRAVVLVIYLIVGIVGCVMSVQLLVRMALWIMPCVKRECYIAYKMKKERMRRRTVIYPIIIYDIPTAEVTNVETIPYPASIVSTAAVEIV